MFKIHLPQLPEKILREKSEKVKFPLSEEDQNLINAMIYHVDESQKPGQTIFRPGVGVAAIQHGQKKQIFYINLEFMHLKSEFQKDVIINPRIIKKSQKKIALKNGEGCLSVPPNYPNQQGLVIRSYKIVVKGFSYWEKKEKIWNLKGYPAIVFQHELDHLEGILFVDKVVEKNKIYRDVILI